MGVKPRLKITVQTARESLRLSLIRCSNPSGGSSAGAERSRSTVVRSVFTKALQGAHFSR